MLCPRGEAGQQLAARGRYGDLVAKVCELFGEGEDVGLGAAVAEGGGAEEDVHFVPLFGYFYYFMSVGWGFI